MVERPLVNVYIFWEISIILGEKSTTMEIMEDHHLFVWESKNKTRGYPEMDQKGMLNEENYDAPWINISGVDPF